MGDGWWQDSSAAAVGRVSCLGNPRVPGRCGQSENRSFDVADGPHSLSEKRRVRRWLSRGLWSDTLQTADLRGVAP